MKKKKFDIKDVADFYNDSTQLIIDKLNINDTLQGKRSEIIGDLFDHLMQTIGIREKMKVLDAGCGIGGPSIYFAKKLDITIDAINVSQVQIDIFNAKILKNDLSDKIKVTLGDYHFLENYYPESHFDVVMFLESFGHSVDREKLLRSAWKVLKSGGSLFIKDPFKVRNLNPFNQSRIKFAVTQNENHFKYDYVTIHKMSTILKRNNFRIEKINNVPYENYDDQLNNQYNTLVGFQQYKDNIPVHFTDCYEILCKKQTVNT